MRKLNVAMLSLHSCPLGELGSKDTGGMSVYIHEVAAELGRQGHSVDIFTRAHDPSEKQISHIEKNVRLIHLQAGQVEQMPKLVLYAHLHDAVCALENYRKRYNIQYDLIHSHYWLSAWVGNYVQTQWKIPHFIMFHTLGAIKNSLGIGEDEPELRIVTETELVQGSQHIIASTESEKEGLISDYKALAKQIHVIPCGVNLDNFHYMSQHIARRHLGLNGNKIILFVGRIDPLKGIDRLLEAISSINSKRSIQLVIVGGDDESQSELERLIHLSQDLKIQKSVRFIGKLKHRELYYYYNAADLCVIPSYYESFCLVALESLACGTPVVATNVGGIGSIVQQGKNGYAVNNNSPLELAGGINALLSNKSLERNSTNTTMIRDSVRRFSWPHIVDALLSEYYASLTNCHNFIN